MVVLLAMTICLAAYSGTASLQFAPSLHTDRTRYAAGDEVTIGGQGFAPHDTVTLTVTHDTGLAEPGMGHEPWTVRADEQGAISATWTIDRGDISGRLFVVTGSGAAAGDARSPAFLRAPRIGLDRSTVIAGEPLLVSGVDFAPEETVTVQITHANGAAEPDMGHEPSTVTAGADGSFEATWTPDGGDLGGVGFLATASGDASGRVAPAPFVRVASIAPDRGDYQPGETAVLAGRGFAPGEAVELQVTHANGQNDGNGHAPFHVTANQRRRLHGDVVRRSGRLARQQVPGEGGRDGVGRRRHGVFLGRRRGQPHDTRRRLHADVRHAGFYRHVVGRPHRVGPLGRSAPAATSTVSTPRAPARATPETPTASARPATRNAPSGRC